MGEFYPFVSESKVTLSNACDSLAYRKRIVIYYL